MTNTTVTQRWVLGLSALASFMVVLDMLVVATALSRIQADLGADLEGLEWTVNAYTLSFAVLLLTGAALGDRFGRRRLFAVGLGLFAVASAGCALAPSIGALIAARTLQGAGAALIMPLALTLLNAAFPPERRGWALGVYGGVTGLAATLGPVIGGVVTQSLDWPWIFWLNVPIGLLAIPLVLSRVPFAAPVPTRLDLPGLVLAGLAAFGLVFGLIRGSVLSGVVGLAALAAFVLVSRRGAAPMLPPRLFASRGFAAGNAAILLINAGLTGALFLIAQWLQVVGGHGPLGAGLRLLPIGLVPLVLGPRAGALADRFGSQRLVAAGGVAMALGLGWFAFSASAGSPAGLGALLVLVLSLGLVGLGLTLAVPACTRAVVSRVAPADMAKASGTFSTLRQLGGAFGVAVLGAVLTPAGLAGGVRPALLVAAALAFLGGVAGALLPSARTVAAGAVATGSVAPGSVAPGSVAPGSVAPGSVASGAVAPGR